MASEEQCLTDQFNKVPTPSVTNDEHIQTQLNKSSELPQGNTLYQSDYFSEETTFACCITKDTCDTVSGEVTDPPTCSEVLVIQDESTINPDESSISDCLQQSNRVEDPSRAEFHNPQSFIEETIETLSTTACGKEFADNLHTAPQSTLVVALSQHGPDLQESVASSLPCTDAFSREDLPIQGKVSEEVSTVIFNIPPTRDELYAKNVDVIADTNNFIPPPPSSQQQSLSPNPESDSGSSSISCDFSPSDGIGSQVKITSERERVEGDQLDVSHYQVFQGPPAPSFQQTSPKDEKISEDKNNENLNVENLTVINKGNNNNNVNVSISENPIEEFSNCKHPLGLVIDVFENPEIPWTKDNNLKEPQGAGSLLPLVEENISQEEKPKTVCGHVIGQDEKDTCSVPPPSSSGFGEVTDDAGDPSLKDDDDLVATLEKESATSAPGKALTDVVREEVSFPVVQTLPSQNITTDFVLNLEVGASNLVSGNITALGNVGEEIEHSGYLPQIHPVGAGRSKSTPTQPKFGLGIDAKLVTISRQVELGQQRSVSLPALLKADIESVEAEPRKTSLLSHGTLPTISEKVAVEEDEDEEEEDEEEEDLPKDGLEEEFEMGFEFNLENSPMLRNSRRKNLDRKRKDCRHLFNEPIYTEDGSGTSEEEEEKPRGDKKQFRSLRDSLDITKHPQLSSDLSFKEDESEVQDILNHNETSPKDGRSPTKGGTSPPGENAKLERTKKLPQYTGKSMSLKKKTSLKGEKPGTRRVSFPEDDARLITGYLEPFNPWHHMGEVSTDAISEAYRKSCERHKSRALPVILQQIAALPLAIGGRIECLSFRSHRLESGQCECLEEIFRRVQFQTLDFEGCELDDDTAIPLFDMVEFYDSAMQLNISSNAKISNRGWQACARMMKRAPSLRMLEARATNLSEQNMSILCKALRLGTRLHTLHLENCNLTGRPLVYLVGALRQNETITDLYLADNRLGTNDCIQLGNLVRANRTLRLLDLRNNNIQDAGCNHICKDITEQQKQERNKVHQDKNAPPVLVHATDTVGGSTVTLPGLTTLVLWNNHITVHAVTTFSLMLIDNAALETLNLGRNSLTSEGILLLKNALIRNRSLRRLGLQATRIGDEGVVALAECLADNTMLARIDLRENNIHVAGLMALCRSLKINKSVVQLDLDSNPRAEPSLELSEQHVTLLHEIKTLCQRNQTEVHLREADQKPVVEVEEAFQRPLPLDKRKISLTCETIYRPSEVEKPIHDATSGISGESKRYWSPAPSPSVSPCPSPSLSPSPSPVPSPLKTRFRVSRVSEEGSPSPTLSLSPVTTVGGAFSVPAPTFFMHPTMGGSLPSLVPAKPKPRRFTVTKVAESSSFKGALPHTSRAMSSPSLMTPRDGDDGTNAAAPTIVVSSPNKAVRGFSVSSDDPDLVDSSPKMVKRRGSLELTPEGRSSSSELDSSKQGPDDVFAPASSVQPCCSPNVRRGTAPQRAPLASTEAGSFDSDSEDSELATQSTDSTRSDEVRVCTEDASFVPAWEGQKGPAADDAVKGHITTISPKGNETNTPSQ